MRSAVLFIGMVLSAAARAQTPGAGDAALAGDPAPRDPRALRVEVGADGEVAVFRGADARPIRGAAVYRAVLRPDLLAAYERKRNTRTFLFLAAAVSAAGGPVLGYLFGDARGTALAMCQNQPEIQRPACLAANEQRRETNARRRRDGLEVGAAVGVPLGLGLAWAGFSVRPRLPGADEARSLVEGYNSRLKPAGAPEPRGMLLLEPTDGGARLVLRVSR